MGIQMSAVKAIARRDLRNYLSNPLGYVFLTLFVLAAAGVAFLMPEFFSRNLADLAGLNNYMPLLLAFFVPALTMGAWSEERRSGTDELLLTTPVRDPEVVLGKYLGVLGLFTISLAFSMFNVVVLAFLGEPDVGLLFANYVGYWLTGALFCAMGLVASMFTRYPVIAFIFGLLACLALVGVGHPDVPPWVTRLIGASLVALIAVLVWVVVRRGAKATSLDLTLGAALVVALGFAVVRVDAWGRGGEDAELAGAPSLFEQVFSSLSVSRALTGFHQGLLELSGFLYFATGIAVALYLASLMLGRRHW